LVSWFDQWLWRSHYWAPWFIVFSFFSFLKWFFVNPKILSTEFDIFTDFTEYANNF
jgi:hypothetical protein